MNITYRQEGDYLLPNLTLDPQPEGEIGIWGWRRKNYLKERRKGTYNALLMKGTLTQHLIDTNEAALDMMETLVKQMAKAEGVTEDLKRRDQMAWGWSHEQHSQPRGRDRPCRMDRMLKGGALCRRNVRTSAIK